MRHALLPVLHYMHACIGSRNMVCVRAGGQGRCTPGHLFSNLLAAHRENTAGPVKGGRWVEGGPAATDQTG